MDLGKADFRKRFVGSYFGIVWMFIQPVVTIVIYAVIFGIGFKSPPPVPGVSYVIWLVPGIVPLDFFFGGSLLKWDHGLSAGIQLSGQESSI